MSIFSCVVGTGIYYCYLYGDVRLLGSQRLMAKDLGSSCVFARRVIDGND